MEAHAIFSDSYSAILEKAFLFYFIDRIRSTVLRVHVKELLQIEDNLYRTFMRSQQSHIRDKVTRPSIAMQYVTWATEHTLVCLTLTVTMIS